MAFLDWLVIAVYGAAVVGIGAVANRRQKQADDYYLGGRNLPWWAVGISILATSFSAATLITYPGAAAVNGFALLQLQIGDLIGFGLAAAILIPVFRGAGLTTAYEYLGRRFGPAGRTLGAAVFVPQMLVRVGVLVYGPALVLQELLGWSLLTAIGVTGVIAITYSALGGIAAVVWTDAIQLLVVIAGVLASLAIIAGDLPGGFDTIFATEAAKTPVIDLARPVSQGHSLPWVLLAYGTLALGVAGTNQQAVQRYLSCRDVRDARRAALTGWGIGLIAVTVTLVLGVGLGAWFAHEGRIVKPDRMLATFVAERLPAGLGGLFVVAIFAAAMSSIDSAIHSMSTVTIIDGLKRWRPGDLGRELLVARLLTVAFGLLGIAAAFTVALAAGETTLLDTLLTWLGYFAGPIVGFFLLGVLTRAHGDFALEGVIVAFAGVATSVARDLPGLAGFHPLWLAPAAALVTFGYGVVGSRFAAPGEPAPDLRSGPPGSRAG